jgi:hypothetical protein
MSQHRLRAGLRLEDGSQISFSSAANGKTGQMTPLPKAKTHRKVSAVRPQEKSNISRAHVHQYAGPSRNPVLGFSQSYAEPEFRVQHDLKTATPANFACWWI